MPASDTFRGTSMSEAYWRANRVEKELVRKVWLLISRRVLFVSDSGNNNASKLHHECGGEGKMASRRRCWGNACAASGRGAKNEQKRRTAPSTRCQVTLFAEKILEDDREDIVRAVIEAAKKGDPTAMRLCIERLIPVRKGRSITFKLPPIKIAADIVAAFSELSRAMAAGELTTDEASSIAAVLEMQRKAIETSEVEQRLQKLEEGLVRQ